MPSLRHICFLISLLFGVSSFAQPRSAVPSIQPAEVLIGIGQSQVFQLLDNDGQEIPGDWAISDPSLAEINLQNGRVKVTTKAVGHAFLTAGGSQAELDIRESTVSMPLTEPRWILHATDGQFTRVVWSWKLTVGSASDVDGTVDLHFPAFFYEDRGARSSHIRAIREDGLEAWRWPRLPSAGEPRLVCGDTYGGVLFSVGNPESRVLINLDSKGRERWRASAPGFRGAMTYNVSGGFFFMLDDPGTNSVRLVGLDSHTGKQTLSYEISPSRETTRNLALRDGQLICASGKETINPLPIFHSGLMTGPEGRSYLMYSERSIVADGGACKDGAVIDLRNVHIVAVQRLVAADIHTDGQVTTQAIEENRTEGSAATKPLIAVFPTGDLIVGDGDTGTGNFVAVRRVTSYWGSKNPSRVEGMEYRVSSDREVLYRMPVVGPADDKHTITLLGEDRIGFTSRGKFLVAFNQDTGQEKWRWQAKSGFVVLHAALKDSKVLVRDGQRYYVLKNGKVQDEYDEDFMLFRMRIRNADDED